MWKATCEAARSTGKPVSGKSARIIGPGLKPSSVFQSVGSMCVPLAFAGRASGGYATRSPVGVEASATRKCDEG